MGISPRFITNEGAHETRRKPIKRLVWLAQGQERTYERYVPLPAAVFRLVWAFCLDAGSRRGGGGGHLMPVIILIINVSV